MDLVEMMGGAGLGHLMIPRETFIREHKNLIGLLNRYPHPDLKKEAASQARELKDMTGGAGGRATGFVRRMMAENALKHKGQYGNPTDPLHPKTTMDAAIPFRYKRLKNKSAFIVKHFGQAAMVPFKRKRGTAPPYFTEPTPNRRRKSQFAYPATPAAEEEEETIQYVEEPAAPVAAPAAEPTPKLSRKAKKAQKDLTIPKAVDEALALYKRNKGEPSDLEEKIIRAHFDHPSGKKPASNRAIAADLGTNFSKVNRTLGEINLAGKVPVAAAPPAPPAAAPKPAPPAAAPKAAPKAAVKIPPEMLAKVMNSASVKNGVSTPEEAYKAMLAKEEAVAAAKAAKLKKQSKFNMDDFLKDL